MSVNKLMVRICIRRQPKAKKNDESDRTYEGTAFSCFASVNLPWIATEEPSESMALTTKRPVAQSGERTTVSKTVVAAKRRPRESKC